MRRLGAWRPLGADIGVLTVLACARDAGEAEVLRVDAPPPPALDVVVVVGFAVDVLVAVALVVADANADARAADDDEDVDEEVDDDDVSIDPAAGDEPDGWFIPRVFSFQVSPLPSFLLLAESAEIFSLIIRPHCN